MQAQVLRTDQNQGVITSQQSLQSIQTLLRAGLGCITYLRNLLPSDNFSESRLFDFIWTGHIVFTTIQIMTVTRGFTEEADKLLDYLENGIFDAVSKQYLRSFVFAIYLDDQDPNNIIEAYSFNFSYCKLPGAAEAVPVMTLGEEMMNLSLSGSSRAQDPVAEATKKGKVPTLGEVKRSLKTLIKNLIQATTQMDALPKRRFATFKLFYYDNTPDDYEPPHFRAGDVNKDKWFMTTHHKGEIPERFSVGCLHTGYHGIDVKVASVSGYIPSGEDNNAPFMGITDRNPFSAPPLTPVQEAAQRAQQVQVQRQDAMGRRIVWDGDGGLDDVDAEGAIEARGSGLNTKKPGLEQVTLIGMRDEDGLVVPFTSKERGEGAEAQYTGRPEAVPACIGQLAKGVQSPEQEMSPTQEIDNTQEQEALTPLTLSRSSTPTAKRSHLSPRVESPLPPSDIVSSFPMNSQFTPAPEDDSMILDMETQQVPVHSSAEDPIESFSDDPKLSKCGDVPMDQDEATVDCECGVEAEDCDVCMCDGGCQRWLHLWCMGYHSSQDPRIPDKFICFDCRVKADRNWDLIVVHDLYPRMIARFKDLAIQRRGIKVFECHAPDSLSAFTKLIGCDTTVAGQVFKRLEAEGFIAQETRDVDDSGFLETTSLTSKKKGKGGKGNPKSRASQRLRNIQKPVFVFVQAMKNQDAYKDYFNPDPEVEKRLLGLSDLKPERKSRKKKHDPSRPTSEANVSDVLPRAAVGENGIIPDTGLDSTQVLPETIQSQTQEETQYIPNGRDRVLGQLKRKTSGEEKPDKAAKKMKISLGPAVDLGD